jgi:hypothetical protein
MDKLLTKKDLAERWQVSEAAIDKWRKEGTISECKGIPSVRFSIDYIQQIEGVKLDKFSPLERKKLQRELEVWKLRAEKAEGALARANTVITEALYQHIKESKEEC